MTDLTRDQLVTEAAKLGITVPKSWGKVKIETAIVEARRKLDTPGTFGPVDPLEGSTPNEDGSWTHPGTGEPMVPVETLADGTTAEVTVRVPDPDAPLDPKTGISHFKDVPAADVDMRRFIAEDKAAHLGIIFGPEWSTEQLEQAIATMQQAIETAPPAQTDGWDTYDDGTHSPRG